MSDTDAATDTGTGGSGSGPLRRIAAAVDRERDVSSRTCLTCGGPTRVVVREELTGHSPPVVSARKECAGPGCPRP